VDQIVGSLGVGILLSAFILNLVGRLDVSSRTYAAANAVGAGLACLASVMISYVPFVVLEGTWFVAAVYILVRRSARGGPPPVDADNSTSL